MLNLDITMLFQLVNFFIVLYVLNILLIRPIRGILKERRDKMDNLSGEADAFEREAEARLASYNESLQSARQEAGQTRDAARAAEQFRRSAEGGCIEAMTAYGVALARGDGVPADESGAVKWFEKAAAAGYPPAMENLSECYARGRGVPESNRKALEWKFRSRAAQGDRAAEDWLKQNVK